MNIEQHLKQIEQIVESLKDRLTAEQHSVPLWHCQQIREDLIAQAEQGNSLTDQVLNKIDEIQADFTSHSEKVQLNYHQLAEQAKHEGWTNYETWTYWEMLSNKHNEDLDMLINTSKDVDPVEYANSLKDMAIIHRPNIPLGLKYSVYRKLIQSAIDRINFTEIAERLIKESNEK